MQYSKIVIHADGSEDLTKKVTEALAKHAETARVEIIRVSAFVVILQWAVDEYFKSTNDTLRETLRAYRELKLDGREITNDMPSPKEAFDGYMIYKDFYERYKELNGDT